MINFVDRFQKVGEESSLYQGKGLIIMTSNMWGHDAAILIISLYESSTYCMDP